MMKLVISFCLLLTFLTANTQSIIPRPLKMEQAGGTFEFTACTKVIYQQTDPTIATALAPLFKKFETAARIKLKSRKCKQGNELKVSIDANIANAEGYTLKITPKRIDITAKNASGVFYAVQTLLQLLPAEIESSHFSLLPSPFKWTVPATSIEDEPRFVYRGIMLDVSRHYMAADSIRRLIDLFSMQKMNTLHLHLTDNDGWRFESKKYPKLTEIGAYRKGSPIHNAVTYDYASKPDDSLYGGYYSQDELRALVKYAADRFITIVPEIELPAHAAAAIASYPFLSCLDSNGREFPYPQNIQGEFCTKDSVFNFLNDILGEVIEIFPSKYIHIGGDEAGKENWKRCPQCIKRMKEEGLKSVHDLQSYFIKRVEKFVNSKGRSIIGWDEIMEGGVAPNAAVMSWTGEQNGKEAAEKDHYVVMTPLPYCYLDHFQSDDPQEPDAYYGLTMLPNVYSYNVLPEGLSPDKQKYILGAQGNLWTEHVPNARKAEYMYFPRSVALAEITWSYLPDKNYEDFVQRLYQYNKRLDLHNVNYSKHVYDIRLSDLKIDNGKYSITLGGVPDSVKLYYTLDGTRPTDKSLVYSQPIKLTKTTRVTAAVIHGGEVTDLSFKDYVIHKGLGVKGTLKTPPMGLLSKAGPDAWHNGGLADDVRINDLRNLDEGRYNDELRSGWIGQNFDATLAFNHAEQLGTVSVRAFHNVPHGIFVPKKVTVLLSNDGNSWRETGVQQPQFPGENGTLTIKVPVSQTARYLRVVAEPWGKTSSGRDAWLSIDEVIVE